MMKNRELLILDPGHLGILNIHQIFVSRYYNQMGWRGAATRDIADCESPIFNKAAWLRILKSAILTIEEDSIDFDYKLVWNRSTNILYMVML